MSPSSTDVCAHIHPADAPPESSGAPETACVPHDSTPRPADTATFEPKHVLLLLLLCMTAIAALFLPLCWLIKQTVSRARGCQRVTDSSFVPGRWGGHSRDAMTFVLVMFNDIKCDEGEEGTLHAFLFGVF